MLRDHREIGGVYGTRTNHGQNNLTGRRYTRIGRFMQEDGELVGLAVLFFPTALGGFAEFLETVLETVGR